MCPIRRVRESPHCDNHPMGEQDASDAELMERFKGGDAAAFEALYRRHEVKVFRYLFRHVQDRAAANDLMQDVWFGVARSADRYQPTAKFTTWLYTLAHHRMVDLRRARRNHLSFDTGSARHGPDDEESRRLVDDLADASSAEPPAAVARAQAGQRLLVALGALPAEQREAFVLQAEGELSVEDIARVTGTSFETVKSRLRYARSKLREWLREYA